MAHYAFLDENNIVTEVIVGKDESDTSENWEQFYGNIRDQLCKRTSYNTVSGTHKNGGTPYRFNYAGLGFEYDNARDAFIPPKPYNSWVLNESTCQWDPPLAIPLEGRYTWNEGSQTWEQIT